MISQSDRLYTHTVYVHTSSWSHDRTKNNFAKEWWWLAVATLGWALWNISLQGRYIHLNTDRTTRVRTKRWCWKWIFWIYQLIDGIMSNCSRWADSLETDQNKIEKHVKTRYRHNWGIHFSPLKEFSMRLRGGSLIQKRWRLEVLSFLRITLSTLEVPSRQTMPAQRLLPWWSRCHGKREHDTFSGLSWVMEAVTSCSWNDTPLWVNRIEHSQYLISIFRAKTALVYSMSHCPWESF